ncbi:hypothetical protein TNCV_4418321 [Trichonephila clavipes]|nr:hypothetical protein TNCV_4418321 [Trichonephila clavipes]
MKCLEGMFRAVPASLVALGNESPDTGLRRKAIRPHSDNIQLRGVSEIRIQNLFPHPQMHPMTNFGAPSPASSVSEADCLVVRH